ncbi:glycerophosphodiester phosphodiesterase family protein [Pseudosulfitobacter sp. DSM 107133]|uniref:glycerophosphodiester phosphodiesterase family protein n=1 Tax=Pseudosulfitobacter sp. DSM 107133 TaxID=2883100 RepID=UPI000DF3F540|nr:glycerophosphodiester phosphodiesterase family protein [Pseudosulfitobacter sp. DSM 107133]UOA28559.1 Glycerophosphodiester phosphodiesterase, cytoplasmic [Pseudosulfitobacter sp. DSM 107133]
MRLPQDFLDVPLAHRALHDVADGRPENSRAAIRAAIAHGYGIEIDLQLSADGHAMVFHDYALDRLAEGSGAVRMCDSATLGRTVLRGSNEGIPQLAEVLEIVAGRVPLLVEFKDQDGAMGPHVGLLQDVAARSLRDYAGPLAVMSFNPHAVARLAEVLPDVPRGLTTSAYRAEDWPLSAEVCDRLREIPDYDRVGACFISHEAEDLGRARVAALKAAGAAVLCWTVCSPEAEAEARLVAQNITFEQYLAPLKG